MRKLMVALAAAGALALAGCSSDSASTTESSAPATDAAVTVTDAWIPQPASDTSAMFGTITNSGTEAWRSPQVAASSSSRVATTS